MLLTEIWCWGRGGSLIESRSSTFCRQSHVTHIKSKEGASPELEPTFPRTYTHTPFTRTHTHTHTHTHTRHYTYSSQSRIIWIYPQKNANMQHNAFKASIWKILNDLEIDVKCSQCIRQFTFFGGWGSGPCCKACRILVSPPGIKTGPWQGKCMVAGPNHWTARELPRQLN